MFVSVILAGPHLVLADTSGDDGIAAGEFVKHLDRHLWQDDFFLLAVKVINHVLRRDHLLGNAIAEGRLGFPFCNLVLPDVEFFRDRPFTQQFVQAAQRVFDVADNRQMRRLVFVEFGRIDIDVHDSACLTELFHLAGHAIIEAHAKGEQQVSTGSDLVHRIADFFELATDGPIGVGGPVHAQPTQ